KEYSSTFYPALLLESVFRHNKRKNIRKILSYIFLILFVIIILDLLVPARNSFTIWIANNIYNIRGAFSVVSCAWISLFALESFFYSYYTQDIKKHLEKRRREVGPKITFELATILWNLSANDITRSFIKSEIGEIVLARCGIDLGLANNFLLDDSRKDITLGEIVFTKKISGEPNSLSDFAKLLYSADRKFADFLLRYGITERDFAGVIDWVERMEISYRKSRRWWSKESLGRIPSIGKGWSYGSVYTLEKYARNVRNEKIFSESNEGVSEEDVVMLENILIRSRGSNALLVTDEVDMGPKIIARLAKKILEGTTLPALEHKMVYILNANTVISEK
ncbi:hypothetical protein IT397_02250, partial [Candidatus Nomurabacteria bacterium]|nr:hypothetical protein [Candidatus Nomurabacteria bacterium]